MRWPNQQQWEAGIRSFNSHQAVEGLRAGGVSKDRGGGPSIVFLVAMASGSADSKWLCLPSFHPDILGASRFHVYNFG